jgi:hypothetical protein
MPNFVMDGTGLICTLQGRTFEKVNPGRAIVGIYANGGGYAGPLLIAETADAVTFWTSNGGTHPYAKTIRHKGVTYYVSKDAEFMPEGAVDTSGLDRYRCSAAGLDAAAEELLNAYEHSNIPTAGQIADYTGTVYNRTGKLYHFDGTAFSQIGKVYDYDGAARHLIYTAETVLLDGASVGESGGWTAGTNPNGSYANLALNKSGVHGSCTAHFNLTLWTNNKIDLSQYSKMTVTVNITANNSDGSNSARYIAILANTSRAYNYSAPGDYSTAPAWGTTYQVYWENRQVNNGHNFMWGGTGTATFTVDISGWTKECYIAFLLGCGPGNWLTATFTKLVLE